VSAAKRGARAPSFMRSTRTFNHVLHRASIRCHYSQRRFVDAKAPLAWFIARFVLMSVPSVRL